MAVVRVEDYHRVMDRRIKKLQAAKRRGPLWAASYMVARAKRLAPRYTGATVKGIRKRKAKRGWIVESWVPGRFKQNLWANRQPGKYFAPEMRWNDFRPTVYGFGPARWSASVSPFFTVAAILARREYNKIMVREVRKSLRTGVF